MASRTRNTRRVQIYSKYYNIDETKEFFHDNPRTENFDENICKLINLTKLRVGGSIKEIPVCIYRLEKLEELNISSRASFTKFPAMMGELKHLKKLSITERPDMGDPKMTRIPGFVQSLTELEDLEFMNMEIQEIPDFIRNLTKLKKLSFQGNAIPEIPECIGTLTHLEVLNLSHNQITEIPDFIRNLPNLRVLRLGHNQITEIPECIGNIGTLKQLDLDYNHIMNIHASIQNLKNITLSIIGNEQTLKIEDLIKLHDYGLKLVWFSTDRSIKNRLDDNAVKKLKKEYNFKRGKELGELINLAVEHDVGKIGTQGSFMLPRSIKTIEGYAGFNIGNHNTSFKDGIRSTRPYSKRGGKKQKKIARKTKKHKKNTIKHHKKKSKKTHKRRR